MKNKSTQKGCTYSISFKNINGEQVKAEHVIYNPIIQYSDNVIKKDALESINNQIKEMGYKYVQIKDNLN